MEPDWARPKETFGRAIYPFDSEILATLIPVPIRPAECRGWENVRN